MSRAYDARQVALKAYPEDREAAIDLFVGYLDSDIGDVEFDLGETIEEYLFGIVSEG